MVQINFARREVNCKIVYYGPGLSGKTTNLEIVHKKAPPDRRGELTSIATEGDRTLFFDYMPLDLGKVGGMNTKFQLYTVPGQVYYNATRKLVLQGVDGVIFVADSRPSKLQENIESLTNLEENLAEQGLNIRNMPLVIQYNKRDLPDIMSVEDLEKQLNKYGAATMEASAKTGEGVFPTLKRLAGLVLDNLNKQYGVGNTDSRSGSKKGGASASQPAAVAAAAPAAQARTPEPAQPSARSSGAGPGPSAPTGARSSGAGPASPPSGPPRNTPEPSRPEASRPEAGSRAEAGPARAGKIGRGIPEPQPMKPRRPEPAISTKAREGGEKRDMKPIIGGVVAVIVLGGVVAVFWSDIMAIIGG